MGRTQNSWSDALYDASAYEPLIEKGIESMSFVGIGVCSNGVLAFGDSKSSLIDLYGKPVADTGRREVRKVFDMQSHLIAAYGNNQFACGDTGKIVNLEDYIGEVDPARFTPKRFVTEFQRTLRKNDMNRNMTYYFLIASTDVGNADVTLYSVTSDRIVIDCKGDGQGIYCGGNRLYTLLASQDILMDTFGKSVEEITRNIANEIGKYISFVDGLGGYNPVGGAVHIIAKIY